MAASPPPSKESLAILGIGALDPNRFHSLHSRFASIQQVELPLPADSEFSAHAAELNRAVDAFDAQWVLILRPRDEVSENLADEIAAAAIPEPRAWGFKIRTEVWYAGAPLRLRRDRAESEVRLFHRRRARFVVGREMKVPGSVVRMQEPLISRSFGDTAEHRQYLEEKFIRRSLLATCLTFARSTAAWRGDMNGLRYLWTEAQFKS